VVIAVDPVPFKRDSALALGATHAFDTIEEAGDFARSITDGQGADSAVVSVGVVKSEHVGQAFSTIRKAGTLAVTGVSKITEVGIPVSLFELSMFQRRPLRLPVAGAGRPPPHPALQGRPAQAVRADHPGVHPGRDQPGLRGHARRPEHPRCHPF
jgi:Zn-dependent alcohol dehydrogenase